MPGGLGLRVSFPQQPVSALVHSFQSHFLLPRFLGDHVTTWKLQVAKLSGVTLPTFQCPAKFCSRISTPNRKEIIF